VQLVLKSNIHQLRDMCERRSSTAYELLHIERAALAYKSARALGSRLSPWPMISRKQTHLLALTDGHVKRGQNGDMRLKLEGVRMMQFSDTCAKTLLVAHTNNNTICDCSDRSMQGKQSKQKE
jgi:hypothetical protein